MKLAELQTKNVEAHDEWVITSPSNTNQDRTTRFFELDGRLYAVWDNGCYFEILIWRSFKWLMVEELSPDLNHVYNETMGEIITVQ
jgi:hypothetical protein